MTWAGKKCTIPPIFTLPDLSTRDGRPDREAGSPPDEEELRLVKMIYIPDDGGKGADEKDVNE